MTIKPILILAGALVLSGAAVAQSPNAPSTTPSQAAPPTALPPTNCAPMTPNGTGAKEDGTIGQSSQPLGDKLAKSDGTLCPPSGVDPEIRAPTPDASTNKMPVIPPPGSPGGDPNVRPK